MENKRRAGILMPISSLPSGQGIGTLGEGAYAFIDFLAQSGMKIWQVLPLLPTGYGDSPYQSCASDALNYYFIDFALLEKDGLLKKSDYANEDFGDDARRVDYGKIFLCCDKVLEKAFARFDRGDREWLAFLEKREYEDFAVFMSLKRRFGYRASAQWGEYQVYDREKIEKYRAENAEEIDFWQFTQYIFLKQWRALKSYASSRNVKIMGDLPIYVSIDSVEMWKYGKELFLTDEEGNPALVAGVPPDAFSADGQLWGNPVYDWKKMKENGYLWWKNRLKKSLALYDILRIDHFRGFDRFYAIAYGSATAKSGEWMDGPKAELFSELKNAPIVAEDLGVIDDGVRALMKETGYPGMKVLCFAFDGNPYNEYKPSMYRENCVAYTCTHDNLPFRAWIDSLGEEARRAFEAELKKESALAGVRFCGGSACAECNTAVRLLLSSRADTVILPMQDVLCLGKESRINAPSTHSNENWSYRFVKASFKKSTAKRLAALVEKYSR